MDELEKNAMLPRAGEGQGGRNSTAGLQAMLRWLPLPKPMMAVEIGSNRGVSTEALALLCGHVVSVDNYSHYPTGGADGGSEEEFVAMMLRHQNISKLRLESVEASRLFADKSVDLVYIDAEHTLDAVRRDIATWLPKTRLWLSGHDYCESDPGVMQAVNEIGKPTVFADSSWLLKVNHL